MHFTYTYIYMQIRTSLKKYRYIHNALFGLVNVLLSALYTITYFVSWSKGECVKVYDGQW